MEQTTMQQAFMEAVVKKLKEFNPILELIRDAMRKIAEAVTSAVKAIAELVKWSTPRQLPTLPGAVQFARHGLGSTLPSVRTAPRGSHFFGR
jgi:hypothetical protein